MNAHLSDEQLHELLFAAPAATPAVSVATPERIHLDACAACQDELASLEQSLGNFKLAANRFSVANAPARLLAPAPRAGFFTLPRAGFFTLPRLVWAGGLAAAMALGAVSVNVLHHPAQPATATVQTQPTVLEATSNVLEASSAGLDAQSDDALLKGIDQDLSTAVAPSLQPLSVTTSVNTPETSTSSSN